LAACGLAAAGFATVGAVNAAHAATPTVLYASPTGSGTTCSQAVPCDIASAKLRVEQLNTNQAADIGVELSGGSYHVSGGLQLGPADSGRNGYHVVWQAASGQVPLISGADKITGFTQYDSGLNIWRAPLSAADAAAGGQQLFVNGQRAQLARSSGSPSGTTVISTGFKTTNASYASFTNQNRIEVVQDNDWKHMSCPVQSITAVSGGADINVLPSCWSANHTHVPNLGFPYNGSGLPSMSGITYVENAYQLLTQPGQF
jgi:hypothetical protein